MANIKLLVMDVDGTLTDGKIYMGQDGEMAKAFDIKDGCGIYLVLPKLNIIPVIITARESKILENRCKELKITEYHQGVLGKLAILKEITQKYDVGLDSVAYIGDDLPDIPCMEEIKKNGGLVLCPADAIPEIKVLADYVSSYKAGEGAVRDTIHYLAQYGHAQQNVTIYEKVANAIRLILAGDFTNQPAGTYVLLDGSPYTIQEYDTKEEADCVLESHRIHIDIQYMLSGQELLKTYHSNCLTGAGKYNEEKDIEFWHGGLETTQNVLVPGSIIVIYNGQPHKGAIQLGKAETVRKLVCKIKI